MRLALMACNKPWEELRLTLTKHTLATMLRDLTQIFDPENTAVSAGGAIAYPSTVAKMIHYKL